MITLTSNSETIEVYDKWAENKDIEWKVNLFNKDASYHGINIEHPETLSIDQRQVEVCVSGSKEGEYRGVLLLKEEQKGNSIVQMGIWLKVMIGQQVSYTNSQTTTQNPSTNQNTNTQPAATNSNSGQVQLLIDQAKENTQITEEKSTADGITGATVGTNNKGISLVTIIIIVGIIGAFIALFTYRSIKRRRRLMEYGY